jgi:hypothetical protein
MRTQNLTPNSSPRRRNLIANAEAVSSLANQNMIRVNELNTSGRQKDRLERRNSVPTDYTSIAYPNSCAVTATGNYKPESLAPVSTTCFRPSAHEWRTITLNLSNDIETALLARRHRYILWRRQGTGCV